MGIEVRNKMLMSAEIGEEFEWQKWAKEIPFIQFPRDWEIQIIPPVTGAVIRFIAKKCGKTVSVYLDCYEVLGYFGAPHWEIYPDKDGDNLRFAMKETKQLIRAIGLSLRRKKNEKRN